MHQRCIDHLSLVSIVHQITQVRQVPLAAADTIPRAVLVKYKHLAGTKPALYNKIKQKPTDNVPATVLVKYKS